MGERRTEERLERTGTKAPPGRRLSARKLSVDAKALPGEAANAFDRLTRAIIDFARRHGVGDDDLDQLLSEGLRRALPIEGRQAALDGTQYAVLALRKGFRPIIDALERWDEASALTVIAALHERWDAMVDQSRFNLDLADVPRWLAAHDGEQGAGQAVADCVRLDAPSEVRIEKRLAQAGAQKRVFAASWTVADDPTEIVVKEFLGEAERILIRERRPHPLSMTHPNIIETFMLDNQASPPQTFLVERRIDVLYDSRALSGWGEVGRLLVDIARALAFLGDQGLVHGDVKPDNIGIQDGRFVLLDFGICRPASEFIGAAQTGSLRTRAPEVLIGGDGHSEKSDIWALGATIFNVLFGRFPLFLSANERPPHPFKRKRRRRRFEKELARRVDRDWEARVAPVATCKHRGLREIVAAMLEREPGRRPDAAETLQWALRELPALVGAQEGPRFAPRSELIALRRHLASDPDQIALLPEQRATDLELRLETLGRALRAHRHYQRAADRLASVADVAREDPLLPLDADRRAHLERLADLARRFRTPEDERDAELLETVREQLGLRQQPEHTHPKVILDALYAALADAKAAGGDQALEHAGRELERLLPAE